MQEDSLVSIIVRTKDRPKLLKRALQSIAAQNYRPIEVVLVNDGGCALDIEELKTILGEVSLNYMRLEENTGRAHAGNVGIENAKGEYVGFLDDDDEFYSEHVETLAKFLMTHEGFTAAYADSHLAKTIYDSNSDKLTETDAYVFFTQDYSFELLLLENYIPLNCLLFHASSLIAAGGFDKSFDLYEDWDLLIRVAKEGPLYHIARTTSKVRQWSETNQITLRTRLENADRASYLQLLKKHSALITHNIIYQYFVTSGIRLGNVVKTLRDVEALRADHMALIAKHRELAIDHNTLAEQHARLTQAHAELEENHKNAQVENTHLRNYTSKLIADLAELKGSFGWKMLESYRHVKDRVFPRSSHRRDFYQMALKVVKTYRNEGFRVVYNKTRRRIRRKMETTPLQFISADVPPVMESAGHIPCRRPVDIVLPVHNGYKELKLCVESILDLTDLSYNRLIIIDDRSTDSKTSGYLRKLDATGKNLTVLYNEDNLGFVKTVNRGMAGSCNDVILLNSDTVITQYWVEKLQRAAYSRERVATVTPFSNHAYHCSIPQPLKYNFLPADFTIASFADFVNRISLRYYPEIPSGSGFCLYITRKALEEVGRFDEELFEKGYGEETDFCLRALKAGWVNLLDDSTYIYHWGGVSFESGKNAAELDEKNRMIQRNLVKLRERHPEYEDLLSAAMDTTLKPLHEYIRLRLEMRGD